MFFGNMFGPPRSPVTFERHPDTPHGCCHGVISMVKCWGSLLQLRHQTSDVDVGLSHGELRDLGSVNLRCHPTSSSIPCFFLLRNFSPNRNHWGQCVARKFLAAPDESSPTHPAPQLFWVQSAGHKLLVWIWMVFFFLTHTVLEMVSPHILWPKKMGNLISNPLVSVSHFNSIPKLICGSFLRRYFIHRTSGADFSSGKRSRSLARPPTLLLMACVDWDISPTIMLWLGVKMGISWNIRF